MVRLEAAGFFPLALVATDMDGQAGLGLVIEPEHAGNGSAVPAPAGGADLNEALEHENRRGAA